MDAEVYFTVVFTALNYKKPHELAENLILSKEKFTCCLNTMLKENYTHTLILLEKH